MYTKEQLEKLEAAELSKVASSLGLKADSKEQTQVIYDILDKQAEMGSVIASTEKKAKKSPARRRTKDDTAQADTKEESKTSESKDSEPMPAETKAKKPTARKSAAKKTEESSKAETADQLTDKSEEQKNAQKPLRERTQRRTIKAEKEEKEKEVAPAPIIDIEAVSKTEEKPKEDAGIIQTAEDFIPIEDLPTVNSKATLQPDPAARPDNSISELRKSSRNERKPQQQDQQQKKENKPAFDFSGIVTASGVLEVMNEGYGFLRSSDYNYLSSPDDIYVNQQQIKSLGLKTGDVVEGSIRPPRDNEKFFPLVKATKINGLSPDAIRDRVPFEHLVPLFPDEKFKLCKGDGRDDISARIVDLFAPIGKGQRALIVAQPKTGKTILMKNIANAIAMNHPEAYLMVLLIDERPEEVTDMARTVNAEVIASTFDEPAERHVKIATIVIEKAKRMVECGHDVVIFLDSITRLARAYNTVSPASGKILSGGVDANALQRPKRFFGAARNIENGGSLTIIATALTDTGSKMDDVIFEEFKGTGNMELQLDRNLANKRIFPAVNTLASSTRRDDLLHDDTTRERMYVLRKVLADMTPMETMNKIKDLMDKTKNNEEFFMMLNS